MNDNDNGNGEIKLASPAGERPRHSHSFIVFYNLTIHKYINLLRCERSEQTQKGEVAKLPLNCPHRPYPLS